MNEYFMTWYMYVLSMAISINVYILLNKFSIFMWGLPCGFNKSNAFPPYYYGVLVSLDANLKLCKRHQITRKLQNNILRIWGDRFQL